MRRLTLTYGLRYQYFSGYMPPQTVAATPNGWVPARSFDEVNDVPLWKDVDPRRGRRVRPVRQRADRAESGTGSIRLEGGDSNHHHANNPINTSVNTVNRTWNDTCFGAGDPRSGNFEPDCDLANRADNGECGAMSNQNFGGLNVTTRYADDAIRGIRLSWLQLGLHG